MLGARNAAYAGDSDRGFDRLLQGRDRVAGGARWRRAVDELIAEVFGAKRHARARTTRVGRDRAAGKARLEAAARLVEARCAPWIPDPRRFQPRRTLAC